MSRLKGKRLKSMVEDHQNWYRVDERPVPSNEDIQKAVIAHNRQYRPEPQSNDSGVQDWNRRQLPIAYQPDRANWRDITPSKTIEPAKDETWTCSVKDVEKCPIALTPQVRVPSEMYQAWTELAEEFSTEWMAYLVGTFNESTGDAEVTDMYFPPQKATGAHVERPDDVPFEARPGTIGAVHSHVKMQAYFSAEDKAHANWPVEIVINARGESAMAARIKLECGRYSRVDGKVLLVGARASDIYRDRLKESFVKPEKEEKESATTEYGGMYGLL